MENILIQFAYSLALEPEPNLLSSIGVDWKTLLLQTIAFLILLWVLKKFVYPPLAAMLDKREADIKASADAAITAERHAAEAEARTAELLDLARQEAAEMVATAREEATQLTETAHKKAIAKTEALVKSAQDEIGKEVSRAKADLQAETLELVALATGKVLGEKVDTKKDGAIITKALKEVK